MVSTPDWHFQGFRSGQLGTLFVLCFNPLEIFIVICVHASICPVSISIFSSFFSGNHSQ